MFRAGKPRDIRPAFPDGHARQLPKNW
jgi:hypothetical protein